MFKQRLWGGVLACFGVIGCAQPDPINLKQEFGKGMMELGVVPFYPLNEEARIGQLYMVDEYLPPSGKTLSWVPSSVVVTRAAVPFMEKFRAQAMAAQNRFPCPASDLSKQIQLGGQAATASYYQPGDCSAPPKNGKPADSLAPLALAGFPSYSLASIENLTIGGGMPSQFANFLAAVGINHSSSMTVQAEGVEVATIPSDQFAAAITQACTSKIANPFSDPEAGRSAVAFARHEARMNHMTMKKFARDPNMPAEPELALYMLRTVYYLRGIRFIFNDSRVITAVLEASAAAKLPTGAQAPAVPNITLNMGGSGSAPADKSTDPLQAKVAALQAQVDSMRSALASTTNAQFGATYTQATSRGIEFVSLFQRPLAFGYVPFRRPYDPVGGLGKFCSVAESD